jgi:hypothetical protein
MTVFGYEILDGRRPANLGKHYGDGACPVHLIARTSCRQRAAVASCSVFDNHFKTSVIFQIIL